MTMHTVVQQPTGEVGGGPAEEHFCLVVGTQHAPAAIRHEHRVRHARHDLFQRLRIEGRAVERQPPQFQLRRGLAGQTAQRLTLLFGGDARRGIHHGDRAHCMTVGVQNRRATIKSDSRILPDQRMGREPRIGPRILNRNECLVLDNLRTEPGGADGLGHGQADLGFEPLPVLVDERDGRDRSTTQCRSQMRQVIEGDVGGRVQNPVARQRGYAVNFVGRRGVRRHTCSPTREQPRALGVPISPRVLPQMPRIE